MGLDLGHPGMGDRKAAVVPMHVFRHSAKQVEHTVAPHGRGLHVREPHREKSHDWQTETASWAAGAAAARMAGCSWSARELAA